MVTNTVNLDQIGIEGIAVPNTGNSTILLQIPYDQAKCTITNLPQEGGVRYNVLLYDVISEPKDYMSLFRVCTKAQEGDDIWVYVDSVGGAISTAIAIKTALAGTKAKVHMVGLGDVMSAATLLVDGKDNTSIGKYSHFMYHMSSSGGAGNTTAVIQLNQQILGYIIDYLKESTRNGNITVDELDLIMNKQQDVYITGVEMAKRLKKDILSAHQTN